MDQGDIVAYGGKSGRSSRDGDELPTCSMCMEVLGTYGGPASLACGHNGCLACLQQVKGHLNLRAFAIYYFKPLN